MKIEQRQRFLTSILTITIFFALYPLAMFAAESLFGSVFLRITELSFITLLVATVIVITRDQMLENAPDRLQRIKSTLGGAVLASMTSLIGNF